MIGAGCLQDSDCHPSDSTKKQICAATSDPAAAPQGHVCTATCQSRTECPLGYECIYSTDKNARLCLPCTDYYECPAGTACVTAPPGQAGMPARTCQMVTAVVQADFGKHCSLSPAGGCNTGAGFFCHGELKGDADAYCTKACQSDTDCYATMYCGTAYPSNVPPFSDQPRRCFLRSECSSCRSDSECVAPNSLCVADSRGLGYCTRACNADVGMPCSAAFAASDGYLECKEVVKDLAKPDAKVTVCAPRYGRCHAEGKACDPCRPHMPEDCIGDKMRRCYHNSRGEGLCVQSCSSASDCGQNPTLGLDLLCTAFQGFDFMGSKVCSAATQTNNSPDPTCWP